MKLEIELVIYKTNKKSVRMNNQTSMIDLLEPRMVNSFI